ncbi:hypothetical protein PROFUN_02144 [Planoprotostelium fungivorum]|uniref:Uncharacterized protein n=1 Tax=Planoprotostelium fungivorum TaxID=1890364 RepID=A0A2P6NZ97_9EUKA|nr:hypothetical protein PROFUN_02144 [Planoprotostelium fungivorum]
MLRFAIENELDDRTSVELAIWFHENSAIYDPKSADNEEKSQYLFEQFANEVSLVNHLSSIRIKVDSPQSPAQTHKVSQFILATKTHKLPDDMKDDVDLQLFLDFDLGVLGREGDRYDEYSGCIRREYIHVPTLLYINGRCKVLTSLRGGNIYFTPTFRDKYEEKAKSNMMREMEDLKAGKIT